MKFLATNYSGRLGVSFTASDASMHHQDLDPPRQQRWADVANLMESAADRCGLPAEIAQRVGVDTANAWLEQTAVLIPFPDSSSSSYDSGEGHNERLLEYTTSQGVRPVVDRRLGIVRGVKVLGLASRNGRVYQAAAIAEAARLYEGVKVNLNHPKANAWGPRDYQDRLGSLRNVCATDSGLFGDFHYNPKHPVAEQLAWDAEHAPENLGLSHNVQARTSRRGNQTVVEAIVKVNSVDLVADPATTNSLFEGLDVPPREVEPDQLPRQRVTEYTTASPQQVAAFLESLGLSHDALTPQLRARLRVIDGETLALLTEQLGEPRPAVAAAMAPALPKSKGPQPRMTRSPDVRQWARSIT